MGYFSFEASYIAEQKVCQKREKRDLKKQAGLSTMTPGPIQGGVNEPNS
jgi:hypothetical protein